MKHSLDNNDKWIFKYFFWCIKNEYFFPELDLRQKLSRPNKSINVTAKSALPPICSCCEEKPSAIAYCHDCRENLCKTCVTAHRYINSTF